MLPICLESLTEVFAQVPDPRQPRGRRHPLQGMLALVFLGLLARIREMAVLQRWATDHWDDLKEPLGFERDQPPHATTISRTLARCDLGTFASAFLAWVKGVLPNEPLIAAVDAKTQIIVDAQAHGTGTEQELLLPVVAALTPLCTPTTMVPQVVSS